MNPNPRAFEVLIDPTKNGSDQANGVIQGLLQSMGASYSTSVQVGESSVTILGTQTPETVKLLPHAGLGAHLLVTRSFILEVSKQAYYDLTLLGLLKLLQQATGVK